MNAPDYRRLALDSLQAEPHAELQLRVNGDSMAPTLFSGEWVLVSPLQPDANELRLGDLLVVRRAGELVTHRLVGRAGGDWLLLGDNRRSVDPPAAPAETLGRVRAVSRRGAWRPLAVGRRQVWLAQLGLRRAGWFARRRYGWAAGVLRRLPPGARAALARLADLPFRGLVYLLR